MIGSSCLLLVIARSAATKQSIATRRDGLLRLRLTRNSSRCGERLELDLVAELGKLSDEPLGSDFDGAVIEVSNAEVLVLGAVLEHVVDGGEQRGGDGADRLLRSASAAQSVELRFVVAVFLALRRPGALDEHGLEPGRTFAQARGFALAGALVVTGAQTRPGHEVP